LASTAAIMLAILAGAANAAGYKVQSINSPGPAIRMNGNGAVTGFFVAKCSTINGYERFTYCYYAPWLFDGKGVTKLTNKFGNNANAQAVAINDSLELVGADVNGAWLYSGGAVIRPGGTGTRLFALNNLHVAVGTASVGGIYQPVTFQTSVGLVPAGLRRGRRRGRDRDSQPGQCVERSRRLPAGAHQPGESGWTGVGGGELRGQPAVPVRAKQRHADRALLSRQQQSQCRVCQQ
jgi:hypothetical protein